MVEVKKWKEFKSNVINTEQKFYLYGAGFIYKKIISVVKDKVICVLDRKYDEVKTIDPQIAIKAPKSICECMDEEIHILVCLNPYKNYMKEVGNLKDYFGQFIEKRICLYCLDIEEIKENGLIDWEGKQELLIDNLTFLTGTKCWNWYMKIAYKGINKEDDIKKLYEEPIEYILYEGKIGLKDFDNGLITHEDGKKKTVRSQEECIYERCIWCFGDSRVSGMLNANQSTFASYLQKIIDTKGERDKVINCGIPGRDIERMVYQIKTEKISAGDIVILATGFYEYNEEAGLNVLIWCEYIEEAAEICRRKGAEFLYINLPTMLEMDKLNSLEKEMVTFFNMTEFREYSKEKIMHYKWLLQYRCINKKIAFYDFANVFEERAKYGHTFINLHHYGPFGNQMIANGIYKILSKEDTEQSRRIEEGKRERDKQFKDKLMNMSHEISELQSYLSDIKEKLCDRYLGEGTIGSIVMNANPFTYGHLYLVDQAIKEVDFLIVFVVSEDASYFSFDDRFEMVYRNIGIRNNVLVVPSGKFCISSATFPEYFKKAELQDITVNAEKDLCLFAEKIAVELNIKIRFVGEEPEDAVTRQYNDSMKKILPQYGIRVVEIPRKKLDNGMVISASTVRCLLKEGKDEDLQALVPKQTYLFLTQKSGG